MIVTSPFVKTRQENPMKSGNLVLALLAMLIFSDVMAQQPTVGAQKIGVQYLCGYGRLGDMATYYDEAPGLFFVAEYSPNLKFSPGEYSRLNGSRALGIGMVRPTDDPELREHFFRKQEFLSQARAAGVAVRILTPETGGSFEPRYCSVGAEFMSIKLCRTTSDCCSGYSECGKEGMSRFKVVPAAPEVFYE